MKTKLKSSVGLLFLITITNYLSVLLVHGYQNGYLFLALTFLILVFVGLKKITYLSLIYALSLPVIGRIAGITLAPANSLLQICILAAVFLILGIAGTNFVIKPRFLKPSLLNLSLAGKYLFVGIIAGVLTWVIADADLYFLPNNYLQISLIIFLTVSEELVFRGLILNEAVKHFHPVIAVIATSILYGSLYALINPMMFLVLYFISMLVSYLYLHDRKIWLTILLGVTWKVIGLLSPSITLF